jgi:hypothetical protein
MSTKQFASLLAFFFIAVWTGPGFGDAILCLIGATIVYAGAAFYRRELDLTDLQQRLPRQPPRAAHTPATRR